MSSFDNLDDMVGSSDCTDCPCRRCNEYDYIGDCGVNGLNISHVYIEELDLDIYYSDARCNLIQIETDHYTFKPKVFSKEDVEQIRKDYIKEML